MTWNNVKHGETLNEEQIKKQRNERMLNPRLRCNTLVLYMPDVPGSNP